MKTASSTGLIAGLAFALALVSPGSLARDLGKDPRFNEGLGYQTGLSPEDLREALEGGDRERARNMLRLRNALVGVQFVYVRTALEAEMAGDGPTAASTWKMAEMFGSVYEELSGDDFVAGYVARWKEASDEDKDGYLAARAASVRVREARAGEDAEAYRDALRRARAHWRVLGAVADEANLVRRHCDHLISQVGGWGPVADCATEVPDLFGLAGFGRQQARALIRFATRGESFEAQLEILDRALSIQEPLDHPWDVATTLLDVGWLQRLLGRGDEARATYERAQDLARAVDDPVLLATALEQRALVHGSAERYWAADAGYLQAVEVRESVGLEPSRYLLINMAGNSGRLGLRRQAVRLLERVLLDPDVLATAGQEGYARCLLGEALGGAGDQRRAALELERALVLGRSSHDDLLLTQALRALRQLRTRMGQQQVALELAEESLDVLRSRPRDHLTFRELGNLATDSGKAGDRVRERELRLEALALARELENVVGIMQVTVQLAEMGLDAGDAEDARPWVEQAVALLPDVEDHGWRMDARVVRARLDELQGDSASALARYRLALDEMRQWKPTGRASPSQLEYIRGEHVRVLSLLQRLASTGAGDRALLDEAFQLAQESHAIELRGLLTATPGIELGDASGLKARRQVVAQERSDVQLVLASAEGERLEALRVRLARLEDDEDLLQRRAALRLGRPSPEQLRPLSLDEVQSLLPQGTALIQQFMGKEQALAFVVTRETAALLDLGESEPIRQAVGFLLEAAGGHAAESVAGGAAQELFERLIRPVQPHIRGARRLVVVPDDVLHALPLEALTGADDRPFLLELPVTYLPTLAFLRRGAVPRELEAMASLVVGAPALPGSGAADAPGAEQRSAYERGGHDLGPLEHAGAEARSVARLVRRQSSRVLTGDEATEADVKAEDLTRYRLLHFATHAIADEQVPLRSALALAPGGGEDGFLEVREILDLDLNADLVVLSACSTGRGRLIRGEGIVGLSRAFLVAGARSLVVSLWNVDDRTTRLLMESFYRNLRKGLAADDALRRAKLNLRSRGGGRFAHPYYWAPFVLVGDPDAASFEQPPAVRLKAAR